MKNVGFIGWRGMVGSVLMDRMVQEQDFANINPVFFTTSQAGQKAPVFAGKEAGELKNAFDIEELKKLDRIIEKEYSGCIRENLIVLDATTGQNALVQAKTFMEATDITGVVLTKMDGTAKGGIAIAIQAELGIPVKYIGVGEGIDDLQKFNSHDFVSALFTK